MNSANKRSIEKKKHRSLTIRLRDDKWAMLDEAVAKTKRTQSSIVNECIEAVLPQLLAAARAPVVNFGPSGQAAKEHLKANASARR